MQKQDITEDQIVMWEKKPMSDQKWVNLKMYFIEK